MPARRSRLPLLVLTAALVAGVALVAWMLGAGDGLHPPAAPVEAERTAGIVEAAPDPPALLVDQAAQLVDQSAPPAQGGASVRVVDERGNPLAGALVRWSSAQSSEGVRQALAGRARSDADLDLPALTADDDGRARLPYSSSEIDIRATVSGHRAAMTLPPGATGEFTIVLDTTGDLLVRVLDAEGRPCPRVPLGLFDTPGDEARPAHTARSDAQGLARFASVSSWLADEHGERPHLRPLIVHERVARTPLPDPSTGIVELRLQAFGSVRVVLRDSAGRERRARGKAHLDPAHGFRRWPWPIPEMAQRLEGSSCLFEHVGLGQELAVNLSFDRLTANVEVTARGPSNAGEVVEIVVTADAPSIVALTLLDAAGAPIAQRTFDAELRQGAHSEPYSPTTSPKGVLELQLPGPWSEGEQRELVLRLEQVGQLALDLARHLPPGRTDLGAFRMDALPLLARGFVRDAEGRPIAGANVRVATAAPRRGFPGEVDWSEHELPESITSEDGAFELRGHFTAAMQSLRARKPGWVPSARTTVEPGAADVELKLVRAAGVRGTLVFDEQQGLVGTFVLNGERAVDPRARGPMDNWWLDLARGKRFAFGDLEPGAWSVALRSEQADLTWHLLDVELRPGQVTDLGELDLRAYRTLQLRVLDSARRPIRAPIAWIQRPVPLGGRTLVQGEQGRLSLASGADGLDLEIWAPECAVASLTGVSTDQEVILERGLEVRLVAAGDEPLMDADVVLMLELEHEQLMQQEFAGSSRPRMFDAVLFDSARSASLRFPVAGTYRWSWSAMPRNRAAPGPRYMPLGLTGLLEIPAGGGASPVTVDLSAGTVARARRALQVQ